MARIFQPYALQNSITSIVGVLEQCKYERLETVNEAGAVFTRIMAEMDELAGTNSEASEAVSSQAKLLHQTINIFKV